ncbi:S-adenosylmethionine synthetase [Bartonella sp. WD12.1]|nr:S-adenosylmethionine synthetase [Bartonella sp. WD12.1]
MPHQNYFFTSESVSEGHPDKICDRISDEIVDMVYKEAQKTGTDPWLMRIACETLVSINRVVIAGEVRVPDTLLKRDRNGEFIYDKLALLLSILLIFAQLRVEPFVRWL